MTSEEFQPSAPLRSGIKLDTTAKGLVTITIHVYTGTTDEELDIARQQAIAQLKKIITEFGGNPDNIRLVTEQSTTTTK